MHAQPTDSSISGFMRRVRRRDTGPEIALRRALHRSGVRFRLHDSRLPGTPDIVLIRARLAVFVDGCFWHGCPAHFVEPKSNREFWLDKIRANRDRDRRVDRELRAMGWTPSRVWEHEDPSAAARRVAAVWRASASS